MAVLYATHAKCHIAQRYCRRRWRARRELDRPPEAFDCRSFTIAPRYADAQMKDDSDVERRDRALCQQNFRAY